MRPTLAARPRTRTAETAARARRRFRPRRADFGDRDQPDRSIVITKIGDRDRSAATLVGQVMSWGSPPFCATVPLAKSGGPGEGAGHRAHQPESDPRRNRATSAAGAGW